MKIMRFLLLANIILCSIFGKKKKKVHILQLVSQKKKICLNIIQILLFLVYKQADFTLGFFYNSTLENWNYILPSNHANPKPYINSFFNLLLIKSYIPGCRGCVNSSIFLLLTNIILCSMFGKKKFEFFNQSAKNKKNICLNIIQTLLFLV